MRHSLWCCNGVRVADIKANIHSRNVRSIENHLSKQKTAARTAIFVQKGKMSVSDPTMTADVPGFYREIVK